MDDDEVWAAVDARRAALVDLLVTLTADQWQRQSLCEAWNVHEVAAHLTMPALGMRRAMPLVLRHPGGTNTVIREASKDLARRLPPEQVVEKLRSMIGFHHHFVLTCREALIDVVGHSLDMAVVLAGESPAAERLASSLPPAHVAEAADRVVATAASWRGKVFRPLALQGLTLRADDQPWSTGSGPEVVGSMTEVFLLLTGRTAWLDRVHGPGAEMLRERVATRARTAAA